MSALLKHALQLQRRTRISTMSICSLQIKQHQQHHNLQIQYRSQQSLLHTCSLFFYKINMKKPTTSAIDDVNERIQQKQMHCRFISSSPILNKRKGGNSAFIVKKKTKKFFLQKKKNNQNNQNNQNNMEKLTGKKKKKKKTMTMTIPINHIEQIRQLKQIEKENKRNERIWDELEKDQQLHAEYDQVFQYLMNLGTNTNDTLEDHSIKKSLKDLDEKELFFKLHTAALLEKNQQVQQKITVEEYNFLLRVYAVKGLHQEANALLSSMECNLQDTSLTPPFLSCVVENTKCIERNNNSSSNTLSIDFLHQLDQISQHIVVPPNDYSYMYYICSLVDSGEQAAALAVRTLGRMKSKGIYPSVNTYNAVMNVCSKTNRLEWSYHLMEKMQLAGLIPNHVTFTILMKASIKKKENEIEKANEIFHLMRSHNIEPDVICFTTLIHGFAKNGRIEKAINLMEDMLENGLTPSQVTFNVMIHACAKSKYFAHKAIDFYHEMKELYDYLPDIYTYNTLLFACSIHGNFLQAEKILEQMNKNKVQKDEITYNTMLNTYARAQIKSIVNKNQQVTRSNSFSTTIEPIYQHPLEFDEDGKEIDLTRPGKETFSMENLNYDEPEDLEEEEQEQEQEHLEEEENALECTKKEEEDLEEEEEEDLEEDELSIKPIDLSGDFGVFQNQNIAKAQKLFDEMKTNQDVVITRTTLNSLLNVYANTLRLNTSEQIVNELFPKYQLEPDMYTYHTIMRMYLRANRLIKAEELYEKLIQNTQNNTHPVAAETFGLLIDFYARRRQNLRRCLEILEKIKDDLDLIPREKHLKAVRRLAEKYGIYTELIPEDPDAVILASSRHKLMEKRKIRAQVIAFNQKKGKKFFLPKSL